MIYSRTRLLIALFAAVLMPLLAVVLVTFPPAEGSLYPRCVFHAFTGLHCPGCGSTRCLSALFQGEVRQAAANNLLLVAALPLGLVLLMREVFAWLLGKSTCPLPWPRGSAYVLLALVLLFGILRNLPVEPFATLAPHPLMNR